MLVIAEKLKDARLWLFRQSDRASPTSVQLLLESYFSVSESKLHMREQAAERNILGVFAVLFLTRRELYRTNLLVHGSMAGRTLVRQMLTSPAEEQPFLSIRFDLISFLPIPSDVNNSHNSNPVHRSFLKYTASEQHYRWCFAS